MDFLFSPIEKFDLMVISKFSLIGLSDLFLTNMTFYLLVVFMFAVLLLFTAVDGATFAITPAYLMVTSLVSLTVSVIDKQVGRKGFEYFIFMFVLFTLILVANFLGGTPFSFAPTSHVVITFFFSLLV